ncbi:Nodal modulator 3 [Hypsibius exemplaris]|uniref:Nodal modulator 3 n=1 Tax=Hypsibius exemplaris TaxID=2072580 RepID=A0A1W0WKX5_HYPEX|nr:Nodal modulator 3 [Hypsibius exemplaris]
MTRTLSTIWQEISPKRQISRRDLLRSAFKPGRYEIKPLSCHKFESEVYTYNTDTPERLSIHAVAHLANITVLTDDDKMSFKLRIKKNSDGSSSILSPSPKDSHAVKVLRPDLLQYSFTDYFAAEEELTIVPASEVLLFKPAHAELFVSENCEKNLVTLEAFKGVTITGSTTPPVADAEVELTTDAEVLRGKTDEAGKFSLGPIPKSALRVIAVEKRGYLFEQIKGTHNFKAAKLSEIQIHTLDEKQQPLPGVLVSISSAAGVRTSNFTDQAGTLSFVSFAPGDYIVRPMQKEFRFDPASKSVTVSQGQTAQVQWLGTRIAYSVFGKVTALRGEPEVGVVFEAVSVEPCPQMQEEAVSAATGQFRISGLKAGCAYEVRAKEGELARLDLKWTSPANRTVQMGTDDITGLSFVAFRGFNEAEFTGRIATAKEFLNQVKVCLYRSDRPDESLQCISFTTHPMFYFNPVPLDGRSYILRLDSTLSRKEFVFTPEELHVKANSTFRHFVLSFTASRRQLQPEIDVATMWIIPFAIAAAILYFKKETAIPALKGLAMSLVSGKSFASTVKDKKKAAATAAGTAAATAAQNDDLEDFSSSSSSTTRKRAKSPK